MSLVVNCAHAGKIEAAGDLPKITGRVAVA